MLEKTLPKIELRTALALMDRQIINGAINTYAVEFVTVGGEPRSRAACCKANPEGLYDFDRITKAVQNEGSLSRSSRGYSDTKERVITLFDMEKKEHFSLKYDLLMRINFGHGWQLIEHVNE